MKQIILSFYTMLGYNQISGGVTMLVTLGEERLKSFSQEHHQLKITLIHDRILHVTGLGHSNAIALKADHSVILIDTLDNVERAQKLKQLISDTFHLPVKTIIYTHGHPDHRGGAGAFKDTVEEIIAFTVQKKPPKYYNELVPLLNQRSIYQFGYQLNDEEAISQGIGMREDHVHGHMEPLNPTTLYTENEITRDIDGLTLQLVRAPGECDDEIFVWIKRDRVLCCADNFYACWPNLYALRGTPYRDIATWIDSLDQMLDYPAQYLLPGHMQAIEGKEKIHEVLTNYRDAIDYVLKETLRLMKEGLTLNQIVEKVQLPEKYKQLDYLQEYYGTVSWSVRSIYNGYVGWFDGNPTTLNATPEKIYHEELTRLIGKDKLRLRIQELLTLQNYQLACELADILQDKKLKANALRGLASQETSANGRHYYLCLAKELEQ